MDNGRLNGLNDRAKRVVNQAETEARNLNQADIDTEHLLLALVGEDETIAVKVLESLGISTYDVRRLIAHSIDPVRPAPFRRMRFSVHAKKVLDLSWREAQRLGQDTVGTEHLLLGLIRERDGVAAQVLINLGADLKRTREQVIQFRFGYQGRKPVRIFTPVPSWPPGPAETPPEPTGIAGVLNSSGRNLTQQAGEGRLDPVVGWDREIERVAQILSRPDRNNPVLVGGTSISRLAVAEGLAQRIAGGEVPGALRNKQLLFLDLVSITAGNERSSAYDPGRGIDLFQPAAPSGQGGDQQAIAAVAAILEEARTAGDVIVFVDKLSTARGAGAAKELPGLIRILRSALAGGELRVIGAAEPAEYRTWLEIDATLGQWLQPVEMTEPKTAYTIGMLKIALRSASRGRIPVRH